MQTTNVDQIRNGWNAYDAKGEHIGDVVEVGSNYALVQKGMFFPKDLYIPFFKVTRVDESNADFFVDVTKDTVESLGWDNPPADGSWDASVTDRETFTVPVREERIETEKHERDAGEVTVGQAGRRAAAGIRRTGDARRSRRDAPPCRPAGRRRRHDRGRRRDDPGAAAGGGRQCPQGRPRRRGGRNLQAPRHRDAACLRDGSPRRDRRRRDQAVIPAVSCPSWVTPGLAPTHAGDSVPGVRPPPARARSETAASRAAYVFADGHGSCLDATEPALELLGTDIETLRMLRVGDLTKPETRRIR